MVKLTPLIVVVLLVSFESRGRADEVAARGILKQWLHDAATHTDAPPDSTATPFEYHTLGVKKHCEGTFNEPKALMAWWKCFRKAEDYLLTDFQNGGELELPSARVPMPKSLKTMAKRIRMPGTWAEGVFVGDGMTSRFLFLTTERGQVAALLVDVTFF
jgi:hypothetical protein